MNEKEVQEQLESMLRFPGFVRLSEENVANVKKVIGIDELNRVAFFPDSVKGRVGVKVADEHWDNFIKEYNSWS
ncbi:hypothetical protein [Paenibacillus xylanexedens]|uniref:Uncharacterized protein n=1 Tax=Paenibacillus xylanexedens TaxID=528191 RepID=A0ABS4RQY6_PAEXY|nr:hypothetical protein [Paenibacillus xylanexedens]MBP2245292.1 hypothetical protein [Paenibacillus xylanexedens]